MMSDIKEELNSRNLIFVLGPGGVGKTTSSIALALAAAKMGKRVGLLSIDPAKRLATAMGIELSGKLSRISTENICGEKLRGTVDAAMLDQQEVFRSMVERFSPSAKVAKKITSHAFFDAISENLAGAIEYMALGKVAEMLDSDEYELIIVDTPPDAHAIDFLERPNILAQFFDNRVITWMLKPFILARKFGLGFALSKGEKLMGGIAQVTGVQAISMMAEFFVLLQDVLKGFNHSGEVLKNYIASDRSAMFLVTTLSDAPIRTIRSLCEQLKLSQFPINAILANRCMDDKIASELQAFISQDIDVPDFMGPLICRWQQQGIYLEQLKSICKADGIECSKIHQIPEVPKLRESPEGISSLVECYL